MSVGREIASPRPRFVCSRTDIGPDNDHIDTPATMTIDALFFLSLLGEVAGRLRQRGLTYGLHGKRLHDANIVATMSTHGIRALITENPSDIALFDEIDLVTVADAAI